MWASNPPRFLDRIGPLSLKALICPPRSNSSAPWLWDINTSRIGISPGSYQGPLPAASFNGGSFRSQLRSFRPHSWRAPRIRSTTILGHRFVGRRSFSRFPQGHIKNRFLSSASSRASRKAPRLIWNASSASSLGQSISLRFSSGSNVPGTDWDRTAYLSFRAISPAIGGNDIEF